VGFTVKKITLQPPAMIYDCFIFFDELDLLELRLRYLDQQVDYFVIAESARTFSGQSKPLYLLENRNRFAPWWHKIIHLTVPVNELVTWEYEKYQRNYLKQGLKNCTDNDLIFISDCDEIVNVRAILGLPGISFPAVIELPCFYYFFSFKTHSSFWVNIVSTWSALKPLDIGYRFGIYEKISACRISAAQVQTGWHFSYLFGFDTEKYQKKISAFSHQEYNAAYWLNPDRIRETILAKSDLFERGYPRMQQEMDTLMELLPAIKESGLEHLIEPGKEKSEKTAFQRFFFLLKHHYYPRLRYLQNKLLNKKQ
jgi:beta-1,4-mannosyl-glycoprotein beta-1,4-N-acetylglucosaminyltransferase